MSLVLVPLLSLTPASPSGVTFAREMLPLLAAEIGRDDLVILCDSRVRELLRGVEARFEVHRVPDHRPARLLADRLLLPRAVVRHRPAVLYVPDGQVLGAPGNVPAVIALHFHLNFSRPRETSLARRAYWRFFYDGAVRRSAGRARALVAPTRAFADEFEGHVPQARGKLVVVPHGVGGDFTPAAAAPTTRTYVLVVANRFAYKNLRGAARIFARASAGSELELRVAGLSDDEVRSILGGDAPARVTALGRLEPARLADEYRGAAALLFPSLVESFGLPVVEAMACGTPVACSDLPALREVAGGAAVLADPTDEAAFAAALRGIIDDRDRAEALRRAGPRRASRFTWTEAARRTADILRENGGVR